MTPTPGQTHCIYRKTHELAQSNHMSSHFWDRTEYAIWLVVHMPCAHSHQKLASQSVSHASLALPRSCSLSNGTHTSDTCRSGGDPNGIMGERKAPDAMFDQMGGSSCTGCCYINCICC